MPNLRALHMVQIDQKNPVATGVTTASYVVSSGGLQLRL